MMLAGCSLLPSSAGLGEQSILLSSDTDDDDYFYSHGISLHHASCDSAITLNSLQNVTALNSLNGDVDDIGLQPPAEASSLAETSYKETLFGSPGSDYLTEAYRALQDSDGIGESEVNLASELLQSDLEVGCSIELSDSDDSAEYNALSDLASSDTALSDVSQSRSSSPTTQLHDRDETQWSKMDKDEQERALEHIASAIRDHANLREQLEMLRLIGQDMTVLPTDSRFQIDPAKIDDDKLKSISKVLHQMALHSSSEANTENSKQQGHMQELKHKKALEQRARHKPDRKRSSKELRQGLKEKRSRLFDQEVVLTLQLQEDDNEEINILD